MPTATTPVPLGPSTLNRKWYLDVNTGTAAAPVWLAVNGITNFKPARNPDMKDDSDFNSGGFGSTTKTAETWSVETKVARKVTLASVTAYDPGQELLRLRSYGQTGPANTVNMRYYEMTPGGPRIEAYAGNAAIDWSDDGGDYAAISTSTVKLMGQGLLASIAHPAV